MAATLRDLKAQLRSGRKHYGFGQEPVSSKRGRPKNYALARFILDHGRPPTTDAEWAAVEAEYKKSKQSKKRPK